MKLFTKRECGKCRWVKERMPEGAGEKLESFDVMTAEGLAELAYHELVAVAEKQLPILVTEEGKVVTGAIPISRKIRGTC